MRTTNGDKKRGGGNGSELDQTISMSDTAITTTELKVPSRPSSLPWIGPGLTSTSPAKSSRLHTRADGIADTAWANSLLTRHAVHLSNTRQDLECLNCARENKRSTTWDSDTYMVERKSKVIEECVTHDTVTATGYAEQCVVELTYPNVHHTGPLDCGQHH